MNAQKKKIAILCPTPLGVSPAQRFRYEQYLGDLTANGWEYNIYPFLDAPALQKLYAPGSFLAKGMGVLRGFGRRFLQLPQIAKADYVFIHREASLIGPPIFEFILAKLLGKKYIYDFDDSIWLPNFSEVNRAFNKLKMYGKVAWSCRWAYKISAGNAYLCAYARQYNPAVVENPTTIDTVHHHNKIKKQASEEVVVGWTGTHTTLKYLDELVPVLRELQEEVDFKFVVIANQAPEFQLKNMAFVQWKKDTEIDDLLRFNIGVMPLTDDLWAKGKCGFKALQYMALGIPALVSPVGVNTDIVDDGLDGFLCGTPEEWKCALKKLISDHALREKMGAEAHQKIEARYSVNSNRKNFLHLFS